MILKFRKKKAIVKVDIQLIITIGIMYLVGHMGNFLIIFISMIMHEMMHVWCAYMFGKKVYCIRLMASGINATIERGYESKKFQSILINISGPAMNLLIFLIGCCSIWDSLFSNATLELLCWANVYLACLNLLPVLPLDGGKIFKTILMYKMDEKSANFCVKNLSRVISIIVMIIGIFQVMYSGYNFSLLLIGLYLFMMQNKFNTSVFF